MTQTRDNQDESRRDIGFLQELLRLKAVPRTGWLLRGVRDVESVAAHSFGVAVIAMRLTDRLAADGQEICVERVLRMALLHDLTETRMGDLPATIKPYFPPAALRAADEQVAVDITGILETHGAEYLAVWREYEQRRTIESRIVKAADKLDLLLQALEYEKGGARALAEFRDHAREDFTALHLGPVLEGLVNALLAERIS
ncbi:MAG: HD domain-containing protein [Blastocatellia bacterium]